MNAYMALARRFGANLAAARERSGLSQEEVGFRAGLHRTEVSILERGARCPRLDTLVKLAAVLDSPLAGPLLDGIYWRPAIMHAGGFDVTPADAGEDSGDV